MTYHKIAYCTLLTNDAYLTAAHVLAQSLRNSETVIPLCALIVHAVSDEARRRLANFYDQVIEVPAIAGTSTTNLQLIGRPDLHTTLTKVYLWSLSQYDRVLYLDADTLVLANLDHLFLLPGHVEFAASPELGFPDCFNSGMMLLHPCPTTFVELTRLAEESGSFDGGDQGLLNMFVGDGTLEHAGKELFGNATTRQRTVRTWYRLSFTYNIEMHRVYRLYIPAVLRYRSKHKVLHFIGEEKPWHFPNGRIDRAHDASAYFSFYCEMVDKWWDVYRQVEPQVVKLVGP